MIFLSHNYIDEHGQTRFAGETVVRIPEHWRIQRQTGKGAPRGWIPYREMNPIESAQPRENIDPPWPNQVDEGGDPVVHDVEPEEHASPPLQLSGKARRMEKCPDCHGLGGNELFQCDRCE